MIRGLYECYVDSVSGVNLLNWLPEESKVPRYFIAPFHAIPLTALLG